jgi:hypothetical protein
MKNAENNILPTENQFEDIRLIIEAHKRRGEGGERMMCRDVACNVSTERHTNFSEKRQPSGAVAFFFWKKIVSLQTKLRKIKNFGL